MTTVPRNNHRHAARAFSITNPIGFIARIKTTWHDYCVGGFF